MSDRHGNQPVSASEADADPSAWYRPAKVEVVDHRPEWPAAFTREESSVRSALGTLIVAIEHIGSTAVPGLAAKPIIDILVGVASWERFETITRRLRALGYVYTPESEADDPSRRVFRKGEADFSLPRTHHLHLTELSGAYWNRMIAFRDHLRTNPLDAIAYERLKHELAQLHPTDPRQYSRGKTHFVTSVEARIL